MTGRKYFIIKLFLMIFTFLIIAFFIFYSVWVVWHIISDDDRMTLSEWMLFLPRQFFLYLKGIIKDWDFQKSLFTKEPIWPAFKRKVVYTLGINLIACIFYVSIGLFLGIVSANKKDKLADHLIGIITNILSACHPIVLTFLLMIIIGYTWRLAPTIFPYDLDTPSTGIKAFIIPVISLSLEPIAKITRETRGELVEVLSSEFILTAKIKGLKKTIL